MRINIILNQRKDIRLYINKYEDKMVNTDIHVLYIFFENIFNFLKMDILFF